MSKLMVSSAHPMARASNNAELGDFSSRFHRVVLNVMWYFVSSVVIYLQGHVWVIWSVGTQGSDIYCCHKTRRLMCGQTGKKTHNRYWLAVNCFGQIVVYYLFEGYWEGGWGMHLTQLILHILWPKPIPLRNSTSSPSVFFTEIIVSGVVGG